jgi:uncharacterized RDD family membrane protein YckC
MHSATKSSGALADRRGERNFGAMTTSATPAYATFGRRFRAVVIDGAIVAGALVTIVLIGDASRHIPGSGRVLVLAMYALILYEPVFVWRYGATIGHRATNLRVVDDASGGNPGFPKALARFVIKTVLGLVSFLTMAITRRYQALHDVVTHTTVQIRDLGLARPDDYHEARSEPASEIVMPSRVRRVVVILLYLVVFFFALGMAEMYTGTNTLTEQIVGFLWLSLSVLTIVAGWRGQLLGCRARVSPTPTNTI